MSIALLYVIIRAYSYRRRLKLVQNGFRYIHNLIFQLRDGLPVQSEIVFIVLTASAEHETISESLSTLSPSDFALTGLLGSILNNAAHCFREMTNKSCTASLILVFRNETDGEHFQSVLYCSDTDPERIRGTCRQRGGLCKKAFDATSPVLFRDYMSEMRKGNFIQFRDDWKKWYRSGWMAGFNLAGKRFGLLNIDSTSNYAFHESQRELVSAFAEACELAFDLCQQSPERISRELHRHFSTLKDLQANNRQ